MGCPDARTAFVRAWRGWEWAALPGAVGELGQGDGGVRDGLFWEVQSGQMRVNRHKLLHWKFLCAIRPVLANTKGVEHWNRLPNFLYDCMKKFFKTYWGESEFLVDSLRH